MNEGEAQRGKAAQSLIRNYDKIMVGLMIAFAACFFGGLLAGVIWGGFSAEANDLAYSFVGVMAVAVLVIIARVRAGYDQVPESKDRELPLIEGIESLRF